MSSPYTSSSVPPISAPQMATTQTQTNQSLAQTQPQLQPQPQPLPQAQPQLQPQTQTQTLPTQPKSDAANQTLPNQAKTVPTPDMKSPTTHSKSVGVEAKQLLPQIPVKSQAMVAPSTKVVPTTISSTIGISVATVSASSVTTTISTAPVVSSSVVPSTVSVAPVMTSTETSTSPPPSSLLENVEISDTDITESISMPDTPTKEPVTCEQPSTVTKVVESEKVVPPPVIKPSLAPVKDKQPQKAIVKPQVLTHVIDGFVIQEGSEPFPVSLLSIFIFIYL